MIKYSRYRNINNISLVYKYLNIDLCVNKLLAEVHNMAAKAHPAVIQRIDKSTKRILQRKYDWPATVYCYYEQTSKRTTLLIPLCLKYGAISTEHSSSKLRVIGTTAHRVDFYFLHLTMHTYPNPSM